MSSVKKHNNQCREKSGSPVNQNVKQNVSIVTSSVLNPTCSPIIARKVPKIMLETPLLDKEGDALTP